MGERCFFGVLCAHKWQTQDMGNLFEGAPRPNERPIGKWAVQQCEHCGKVKYRTLS